MAVSVPSDFPREPLVGGVSGAQPKLLARLISDKYNSGITEEEWKERYEICQDLSQQLILYCQKKQLEKPKWSIEDILRKTSQGIRSKNWEISETEFIWMMERVAQGLRPTQPNQ